MAEEGTMEDSSSKHHIDSDEMEEKSASIIVACSPSTNSIDIYEDILFFSPLTVTEKPNKSPHFKKPNKPPPEEESVDLYSEFMDKKSKWNQDESEVTDPSLDESDLCTGVDEVGGSGTGQSVKSSDDTQTAVPESETDGDVNLDLFTEVLTDELQQRHDSNVEMAKKYAVAEARNQELESELKISKAELEKFKAENVIIKKNISSLLLTAKTELKRKDDEIKRLNSLLTKKNINNFWTRRDDPKKTKEMSPGRQRVADIWNSARKASAGLYQSGDTTPSKRSKDTDSDSVKRKRNELADYGTPKRQKVSPSRDSGTPNSRKDLVDQGTPKRLKVSPSRHSGTPTSRKHKTYDETVDGSIRESKKQTGTDKVSLHKESSGRSLRSSGRIKSDEKGNKENREEQRSRGKDTICSNQHARESSEKSVTEGKKTSGGKKNKPDRKSSCSRSETKQGSVDKAPGVKDLRDILRRKREGKSSISSVKSISSSDRKRHASDSKHPPDNYIENRTEKESSPCSKKRVISKVIESEGDKSENEHSVDTNAQEDDIKMKTTSDCDTSESVSTIRETIKSSDTEFTVTMEGDSAVILPVADTTASKQSPDCIEVTQTNDNENLGSSMSPPKKCALEITETSDSSPEQLPKKASQIDVITNVSQEVSCELSQLSKVQSTQPQPARKEKRRIKPIMISGKKSATSHGLDKDGQCCFDAVIKNIEERESAEFAQAKVIHVDSCHEEQPFVPAVEISVEKQSTDIEVSLCKEKTEENSTEDNSKSVCSILPISDSIGVSDSDSKTNGTVVKCLIDNMHNVHYSVEENEHILLCTKNPDQDNSSTSVSNEPKVEPSTCDISDRECSVSLIIEEETCSRAIPYNSSRSFSKSRTLDTKKYQRCSENSNECIPEESRNKSKKKKKHKKKYPKESVDNLEGITKTSLAERVSNKTDQDASVVCHEEKALDHTSNTSLHVNVKETPEVSETISVDVHSKDLSLDMQRNSDVNHISEIQSVKPTDAGDGDNVSPETKVNQHTVDVSSNSSVKDGDNSTSAAAVLSEVTPNTSVIDRSTQVAHFQVPCVDARLNGSKRPYHVERFEFSSFPEFYAKSESEDEDRLLIAGLSESDKESKNRDSSFEMDTYDASETVRCITPHCRELSETKICSLDKNDTDIQEISAKPKLATDLQEHLGDGAEDSSGFYPNDISVEFSENRIDSHDNNSVHDHGPSTLKHKYVKWVEGANSPAEPDQVQEKKDVHGIDDDNSVIHNSIDPVKDSDDEHVTVVEQSDTTVLHPEIADHHERKKQDETYGQRVQMKAVSDNSDLLKHQRKMSFNRQSSLPTSEKSKVDNVSTSATRTRSCSAPQSISIRKIESHKNSGSDQVFDLSKVKPCWSPVVPIACHPIDLSVKSVEKTEQATSPGFSYQTLSSGYLSGFSISKDGALDLTKTATQNSTGETTPFIGDSQCNNDNSWTNKINHTHQGGTEKNCEGLSPKYTSLNDNIRSESGHLPQNDLKPTTSAAVAAPDSKGIDLKAGIVKTSKVAVIGNGNLSQLTGNESIVIEKISIEATVVMEDSSSEDEDNAMDVSGKSSNVSIQSLDSENSSVEDNSQENSVASSPCNVVQNHSTSSSNSESEEDSANRSETCTSKSVSNTQISSSTSKTSAVSSNVPSTHISSGVSNTSVHSSSEKLSAVSSVTARSASSNSSDSSPSEDDESDSESSEGDQKNGSSEHEDSDVCVTDDDYDDQDCEKSQSQILAQSLSSESVQSRSFDIVKQDLQISSDSSLSCRDSQENLLPSKSSSNMSNDGETLFKLPDMSTSAFAKLTSTSHSDVTKSLSSSAVKPKSSEVLRKKQSFPVEENSVLSILADSCDGFDCEQDDHKEDCRKYLEESPAEPEEEDKTWANRAADSEVEEGCVEDGELSDDEVSPKMYLTKPVINEEESQELVELLRAKKLLEDKIHGICKKSSVEPLSSKSGARENRHKAQTYSSSRTDRKSSRSSRDSREKDSHRGSKSSSHEHDRFSREIYGNDPRLSDRSSSRYRRDKDDPRHKHYSPSTHSCRREDRRERHRDGSPISHRSSYKDQSKENHRRESGDRHDRYPVDGRYRNRPRDIPESDRSKSSRSSGSHHSSRRSSRDFRS